MVRPFNHTLWHWHLRTVRGDIETPQRISRGMKKTIIRATLLCLMLMIMGISPMLSSVSASEPPDGDASITINGEHTWSQNDTLNGTVIVSSGATLVIDSTLTVTEGSSIQVENGGQLDLGGKLIAENTDIGYEWMRNNDAGSRSRFLIDNTSIEGGVTVTISAYDGTLLDGFNVVVNDMSSTMTGSQHNITFEVGTDDTWIEFTGIQSLNLVLDSSLSIENQNGVITNIDLWDDGLVLTENWMIASSPQFEIDIKGEMFAENATIVGAEISVDGKMYMDGLLDQSTPILAGNSANITLSASLINSRDDHHVTAGIATTLDLQQSSVRGTLVDFWERQLDQQIQFRANEVIALMTDFGYPPQTTNPIPVNADGLMTLPKRTVQIGFSDGTIWNEQATIVINSYKTAWNAQLSAYGSNEPLPIESFTNYTSSNLPILSIDSITPEQETNSVDSRIKMNATITNSGEGDARIALECFLGNGSVADVGGYPILEIPGGETRSVEFNWNMFEPGNTTINCGVIQPSQLVIVGSYGGDPVDSEVVMWTAAIQQESGLGVLPIIVVAFVLLVGAGIWILQVTISSQNTRDEEKKERSSGMAENEEINE